eukprot:scaffold1847_cov121-Alexandrium_tamarense.AAC.1
MSLAKTNAPGEAPSAVATVVLIACMAVDSASSISSVAFSTSVGGVVCKSVLKMLPTVWCILSHIALDCGLRLVVGTSLMFNRAKILWNSYPVNSPPLSWMHRFGSGYLANQACSNLRRTCFAVLLSMRINSTKFDTGSMHVKALNSYFWLLISMVHGPIKSIATSSQGATLTSLSLSSP